MLAEMLPYFLLLYLGMTTLGMPGAALAAAVRNVFDFLLLTWVADKRIRNWRTHLATMAYLSICVWLASLWTITNWRWWLAAIILGGAAAAWSLWALPADLRALGVRNLQKFQHRWMVRPQKG